MWRRLIGLLLTALGSGAVAAAVTLALVGPALVTLPPTGTVESTAHGTGAIVFSSGDQKLRTDVDIVSRRVTTGTPASGPLTRTSGTVVTDTAGRLISTDEVTFCPDPRTAAAVQPCAAQRHNGAVATVTGQVVDFPLGTGRADQTMFDGPTGRSWPMLFDDADLVDGLDVLRFVQQVPATVIGHQDVPATLAGGAAGATVPADIVYSATRTVWVEPRTGILVKDVQEPLQYLRVNGKPVLVLLQGSVVPDTPTIADAVARAGAARGRILLWQVTGPWVLGGAGILALVAGLALARRRPPGADVPAAPQALPSAVTGRGM